MTDEIWISGGTKTIYTMTGASTAYSRYTTGTANSDSFNIGFIKGCQTGRQEIMDFLKATHPEFYEQHIRKRLDEFGCEDKRTLGVEQ